MKSGGGNREPQHNPGLDSRAGQNADEIGGADAVKIYDEAKMIEDQNTHADNVRWVVSVILACVATAALVVIAWKI